MSMFIVKIIFVQVIADNLAICFTVDFLSFFMGMLTPEIYSMINNDVFIWKHLQL